MLCRGIRKFVQKFFVQRSARTFSRQTLLYFSTVDASTSADEGIKEKKFKRQGDGFKARKMRDKSKLNLSIKNKLEEELLKRSKKIEENVKKADLFVRKVDRIWEEHFSSCVYDEKIGPRKKGKIDYVEVEEPSNEMIRELMTGISPNALNSLCNLLKNATNRGIVFLEENFRKKLDRILLRRSNSSGQELHKNLILFYILEDKDSEKSIKSQNYATNFDLNEKYSNEKIELLLKMRIWSSVYSFGTKAFMKDQNKYKIESNDEAENKAKLCVEKINRRLPHTLLLNLMKYLTKIDEEGPKRRTCITRRFISILGKRAWIVVPELCSVLGIGGSALLHGQTSPKLNEKGEIIDPFSDQSWIDVDSGKQKEEQIKLRNLIYGLKKRVVLEGIKIVGPFNLESLEDLMQMMDEKERAVYDIVNENEIQNEKENVANIPPVASFQGFGAVKYQAKELYAPPPNKADLNEDQLSLAEKTIFLQNLPQDADEDIVQNILGCCGQVKKIAIFRPPETAEDFSTPMINQIAEVIASKKASNEKKRSKKRDEEKERPKKSFVHARITFKHHSSYLKSVTEPLQIFGIHFQGSVCRTVPAHKRTYLFVDPRRSGREHTIDIEELEQIIREALSRRFQMKRLSGKGRKYPSIPPFLCINFPSHMAARAAEAILIETGFSPFWFYHHEMRFRKPLTYGKLHLMNRSPDLHKLSLGPSLLDSIDLSVSSMPTVD